jgi:hypothetical protein
MTATVLQGGAKTAIIRMKAVNVKKLLTIRVRPDVLMAIIGVQMETANLPETRL